MPMSLFMVLTPKGPGRRRSEKQSSDWQMAHMLPEEEYDAWIEKGNKTGK